MKKIILLCIASYFLLNACSTHCDDFNADILNWIPYKINDTISLKDDQTIKNFVINSIYLDHTKKVRYGVKCGCGNSYGFEAGDQDKYIHVYCSDDKSFFPFIQIKDGSKYGSAFDNMSVLSDITIASNTYQDAIAFSTDSTHGIWKIIFAKNKGIVAIYYHDSVMMLTKNIYKETTTTDYNLNNTICGK